MAWPEGIREPTDDECSSNARVGDGFAIWYPQMGGYGGKAVVVPNSPDEKANDCMELYVWHDGAFPFSGESCPGRKPVEVHHCDPLQFIRFGEACARLMGIRADPKVARVLELETALKAAQWGACDTCGWHIYCPACKGPKPDPDEDPEVEHGHKPDCVVGKALGARDGT